jgi:integrase/recombinase XerD
MAVSMSQNPNTQNKWSLDSARLLDAYTDFVLSRQAMQCSAATLQFYRFTAGKFVSWIEGQGITTPEQVTARHVRQYIAELQERGKQDSTLWDHARAIRTLLLFWHREKYIREMIRFETPKVAKKRLPVLSADELRRLLKFCNVRDKAIVMLIADSGLRRAEVCALNWDDIDFGSGLIHVKRGKGGKARSSVIGATARRALLAYRRTINPTGPVIQAAHGVRLQPAGFGRIFARLSARSGIHVTAHALRRTFVVLSLQAGMSSTHLQALGGWSGLEMVTHYAQLQDEDLLRAHQQHSPIDTLRDA